MVPKRRSKKSREIRAFTLANLTNHPKDIAQVVARKFEISRQAAVRHVKTLVDEGLLETQGKTKARSYQLKVLIDESFTIALRDHPEEDVVWRNSVLPILERIQISQNVTHICQYGFSEILNNAIDHSETEYVFIEIKLTCVSIRISVTDFGVGIFQKLQRELSLNDPRHALLELTKGKLTTNTDTHTGEGIFFTSRMFDEFSILSGDLFFRAKTANQDWLIESEDRDATKGTRVSMEMGIYSQRTTEEVFSRYSSGELEYGFSRTLIPVKIAKYSNERLVSRSQAKRILARVDKFREIVLDFSGIAFVGRSFVDEIFRIFPRDHPDIKIYPVNVSSEVEETIRGATPLPPS